jgi:hypothetical protein
MPTDDNNGQPSIDTLSSEGVSIRKCIASGENYGGSSGKAAPKSGGGAKPKGALSGLRMKGGY